jgi:hypothetical protein
VTPQIRVGPCVCDETENDEQAEPVHRAGRAGSR